MTIIVLILCMVALTGVVSAIVARLIRSTPLAIFASTIMAELLFALFDAYMKSWPSASEVLYDVIWGAFFTLPIILASSIGFVLLSRRFYKHDHDAA